MRSVPRISMENMKKQVSLVLLAGLISGCAANGRTYSEYLKSQVPLAPDSARVVVYRSGDDSQGSGRDTRLSIDGKIVGKVAHMGFSTFEVPRGSHVIAADLWDSPGACQLKFDARPNTDYYFEVTPRIETLAAGLLLGVVGQALESAGNECGGSFAIAAQPKRAATYALVPLRMTE